MEPGQSSSLPPDPRALRPAAPLTTRSAWLLLAVASGGCAQLWKPLGVVPGRGREALPPAAAPAPGSEPPAVVLTGSVEQRYPYVRFVKHGDDDYTAFVTVPMIKEAPQDGQTLLGQLKQLVTCDDRAENPATLEIRSKAGLVYLGKAHQPDPGTPTAAGNLEPVEDLLVVRGRERDIDEVLGALDLYLNSGPQIEIQAQIVEVTDSTLFERGIVPVSPTTPLIANRGTVGPGGEGPFLRAIGGAFPTATGQNLAGTAGSGLVGQISLLQNDLQLQALIQLLETTDGVDIVSRPRVVVRNGVTADLSSAERIPYLKATQFGVQGITQQSLDYQNVGVNLYVLPFLLGGDTIHMVIEASVSRLGRNILLATDAVGNPFYSPSINTRAAKTSVAVRSGQSVVIGGLRLKEMRATKNKVPILGDIPLLQYLFSSESEEDVETEVLFVITPYVKTRGASISPFGDIFDPFTAAPRHLD